MREENRKGMKFERKKNYKNIEKAKEEEEREEEGRREEIG